MSDGDDCAVNPVALADRFTLIIRIVLSAIFSGLWIASLIYPAAYDVTGRPIYGYEVLVLGFFGVWYLIIGWFANIILPISLFIFVSFQKPALRTMNVGALLLGACALSSLLWNSWPHATQYDAPIKFGPAFYLWMSAVGGTAITLLARAGHGAAGALPDAEKA
jgi:hypothetical protein